MNDKPIYIDIPSNLKPPPPYRTKYAVLVDKSPAEIIDFAERNEGVVVFTFITDIKTTHDYSTLHNVSKRIGRFILMPQYIGNQSVNEAAIQQMLEMSLGDLSECDEVSAAS